LSVGELFGVMHDFFAAFNDARARLERRRAQEGREARVRQKQTGLGAKKSANLVVPKKSSALKTAADEVAKAASADTR
jgi:hypothetical protein